MKDEITKLYEAVAAVGLERGEPYVSVSIECNYSHVLNGRTPITYKGYIYGYDWHTGKTIAEVVKGLKGQPKLPPKTSEQKQEDINLPF